MNENPYPRFRWLEPGAIAGGPDPALSGGMVRIAPFLRSEGVGAVVTLLEERLSPSPESVGLGELFAPTPNYGPPTNLQEIIGFIEERVAAGEGVLVHCFAGIGRTGTVLVAWLLHRDHSLGVDEAIVRVRDEYTPDYAQLLFPEDPSQEEAMRQFAEERRPR